jgi:hypothetical protein
MSTMAKKRVNLELFLNFGVFRLFWSEKLCFETDRMRMTNVGLLYICYDIS